MLDQNVLRLTAIHPEGRQSRKIILPPKASSDTDVFASAILDETTTHRKRPLDLAISLGLHVGVLVFVLLLPLFFSSGLDLRKATTTFLVAPVPPSTHPPAPPQAMTPRVIRTQPKQIIASGKLTAPSFVPRKVAAIADDAAPVPDQAMTGVVGGLPGGIGGGPIGSLVNVDASIPAAPKLAVAEGPKKPVRVGGAVTAPRIIYAPALEYPILARQSHVSGTVVIEAVIDEHGNVVEARAVSGHALLIAAALKAVSERRYEPTILDGEPTPVALRVEVNFHG